MNPSEIHFIVEEAPEGGHIGRAVSENIFTEAGDISGLHARVRDAVRCHFDDGSVPGLIRLHFTREEVITTIGERQRSAERVGAASSPR